MALVFDIDWSTGRVYLIMRRPTTTTAPSGGWGLLLALKNLE